MREGRGRHAESIPASPALLQKLASILVAHPYPLRSCGRKDRRRPEDGTAHTPKEEVPATASEVAAAALTLSSLSRQPPDGDGAEHHGESDDAGHGRLHRHVLAADASGCMTSCTTWNCGQTGACQYMDSGNGKNMPER